MTVMFSSFPLLCGKSSLFWANSQVFAEWNSEIKEYLLSLLVIKQTLSSKLKDKANAQLV